jgi:hypothetical protein
VTTSVVNSGVTGGTPWFAEKNDVAAALQAQVDVLERSPYESTRRQQLLYDCEFYLGQPLSSLYELNFASYNTLFPSEDNIAFNICYSIPNAIQNRICSFRTRAQFLPNGGNYLARRASRDMTEMSDAWAEVVGFQAEAAYMFRDLLTGDGGVLKHYIDGSGDENDTVVTARFPSWEFYFDEAESIYRRPECAYHVTYLPVEQAAALYRVDVEKLRATSVTSPTAAGVIYITNRNLCRIVEAWQRGPEGRHVVIAGPVAVLDEDWEWDGFPLTIKKFDERFVGMWGEGAIRRLRPLQLELIEWATSMRDSHRLTSLQVWQTPEDEAGPEKLNNAVIRQERYRNRASTVINPSAAGPEMYQYYNTCKQAGYETLGVAQGLAKGEKQPGITAAIAIRESSEIQTDRLALLSQTWEDIRVDAAGWWWKLTKKLATREENPVEPKWRGVSRGVWRELTLGDLEQEFEIRRFPSSVFGQTVSGRFQRATELIQSGFITKEDALKAMDIPDLAPLIDIALAEPYAMERLVDDILEKGKYKTPDEQIDPVNMYEYARKRYLKAISDDSDYPEENLSLMRKLLAYMKPKADAAKAPPPMPAPVNPPGIAPPGAAVPPGAPAGQSPEEVQQAAAGMAA